MPVTANDIDLASKANQFSMDKALAERLIKLINKSDEKDKIRLAINYSHSVTKSGMRGTR